MDEWRLLRALGRKERDITEAVAKGLGLDKIEHLSATTMRDLKEEVETIIDSHEEALQNDTAEERRAKDVRLASTDLGRLLQERYMIAKRILGIRQERMQRTIRDGRLVTMKLVDRRSRERR